MNGDRLQHLLLRALAADCVLFGCMGVVIIVMGGGVLGWTFGVAYILVGLGGAQALLHTDRELAATRRGRGDLTETPRRINLRNR